MQFQVLHSLAHIFILVFQHRILIHLDTGIKLNAGFSDKYLHIAASFLFVNTGHAYIHEKRGA